jgi:PKD repeat protein
MPVKSVKTSFKWAWVASSIIIVGVAAFFALQKNETRSKIAKDLNEGENPISNENNVVSKNATVKQIASTANVKSISDSNNVSPTNDEGADKETINGIPPRKPDNLNVPDPTNLNLGDSEIILPKFSDKYCENEIIEISNSNDRAFSLISSNGTNKLIKEKNKVSIDLLPGDYFFSFVKNGKIQKAFAFSVSPKVKADFYADEEMVFYKGLPVSSLNSMNSASKYTWTNEKGIVLSREKSFDAHFFTKGNHAVTLTLQSENGCESKITKNVRCEASYNLLAMNSFIPTSSNSKINTFLPYALLERNVPFTMQIIDPKTGQTIYETKSESEPWDGNDRRTQQLIAPNTPYIWRVNLEKTEIGESKNYQGTITRFED